MSVHTYGYDSKVACQVFFLNMRKIQAFDLTSSSSADPLGDSMLIAAPLPQEKQFANTSVRMAFGTWDIRLIILTDEKSSSFEGGFKFGNHPS